MHKLCYCSGSRHFYATKLWNLSIPCAMTRHDSTAYISSQAEFFEYFLLQKCAYRLLEGGRSKYRKSARPENVEIENSMRRPRKMKKAEAEVAHASRYTIKWRTRWRRASRLDINKKSCRCDNRYADDDFSNQLALSFYLHKHDHRPSFVVGDHLAGDLVKIGVTSCPVYHAPHCYTDTAFCRHPVYDLRPCLTVDTFRVDEGYVGPVVVDQQVNDGLSLVSVGGYHASEVRVLCPVTELHREVRL